LSCQRPPRLLSSSSPPFGVKQLSRKETLAIYFGGYLDAIQIKPNLVFPLFAVCLWRNWPRASDRLRTLQGRVPFGRPHLCLVCTPTPLPGRQGGSQRFQQLIFGLTKGLFPFKVEPTAGVDTLPMIWRRHDLHTTVVDTRRTAAVFSLFSSRQIRCSCYNITVLSS
jgi:hypothetical protein